MELIDDWLAPLHYFAACLLASLWPREPQLRSFVAPNSRRLARMRTSNSVIVVHRQVHPVALDAWHADRIAGS
jgi:hypothetical protein